jgi:hypothetical protein
VFKLRPPVFSAGTAEVAEARRLLIEQTEGMQSRKRHEVWRMEFRDLGSTDVALDLSHRREIRHGH